VVVRLFEPNCYIGLSVFSAQGEPNTACRRLEKRGRPRLSVGRTDALGSSMVDAVDPDELRAWLGHGLDGLRELTRWLGTAPEAWSIVIGARAALRDLPLIQMHSLGSGLGLFCAARS
jgi:hypothetical protein